MSALRVETSFRAVAMMATSFGYALIASRARALVGDPHAIGLFNKADGTLLIGAGIATVAVHSGSN